MTHLPDTTTDDDDAPATSVPDHRLRTDGGERPAEDDNGTTSPSDPDLQDNADSAGSRDLSTSLEWAALLILGLLAVIATFRFYLAASTAIGRLVTPEYEPLFQAGFNLVVLLLAITGISILLRRTILDS